MQSEEGKKVLQNCLDYSFFTWTPQNAVSCLTIDRTEGIYLYDYDGKRYTDLSSMMVSQNLGFGNPNVIKAVEEQLERCAFVAPRHATWARGEFARLMIEEIAPKNMAKVITTSGGADANEYAMRIAREVTGKGKIFAKYDSYHGSHFGSGELTGTPGMKAPWPAVPGIIHFVAPHMYTYDLEFKSEEEATKHFLASLERQIVYEEPETIAALFIEGTTGSNGIYLYPKGYLEGVRELCTKYNILMVVDEVMAGFLRCGEWFSFMRSGIEPDMVTFAKGVTSSMIPFGGVLMSKEIAKHYETKGMPGGITYNSHPMGCACAIATIREYQRLDTRGHVLGLEDYFAQRLAALKENHPSIGDTRSIGFFGVIEFVRNGDRLQPMSTTKDGRGFLGAIVNHFYENGYAMIGHDNKILIAPPLITTKEQLDEIFDDLDKLVTFGDEQL